MVPQPVTEQILEETGISISSGRLLGGGSINQVAIVNSPSGERVLKWNTANLCDMFVAERKGLELLRASTDEIVIPEVFGSGKTESHSWLLISYIPKLSGNLENSQHFGQALAGLHRYTADRYGLDHHNYIGRLPQQNTYEDNWPDFFIRRRIRPQIKMAVDSGKMDKSVIKTAEKLYQAVPDLFPHEPASLIHGDLWGGNYMFTTEGKAAIFDPAVYYGHREIEIAFTQLFGGFDSGFYRGYESAWPLEPGFEERVDVYNLYPLLVHVNLFGGGYVTQALSVLNKF